MFLVWVKDHAGNATPQIWTELYYGVDNNKKSDVVQVTELEPGITKGFLMGAIQSFVAKYPCVAEGYHKDGRSTLGMEKDHGTS